MPLPSKTDYLSTPEARRRAIYALAKSDAAICVGIFFLGTLVRLYFALSHPHFDNIFAVKGAPYSDGFTWTSAAIEFARGNGLGPVYRPGFSVLLAFFYVWFGYSAFFITAAQILIGAMTGVFIYLVGVRTMNRIITAGATCFFIFDFSQLTQTPQSTTEPLGLFFFVASVYCLLLIEGPRSAKYGFLAGTLIALSNLTRPLTLFCTPFYALQLAAFQWSQSRKIRRAFLPAIALCTGVVLTLGPWLVRQKATYGVWAISTNAGEALYGATSPKYGTWTSLVRADADRDGVANTIGARYRYFVDKSLDNLRRFPAFYVRAVTRSYWDYLNCFNIITRSNARSFSFPQWTGLVEGQLLFILLLATFLLFAAVEFWVRFGTMGGGTFLLSACVLCTLWWLTISINGSLVVCVGIAVAVKQYGWHRTGLLASSLLGAELGDAVFNNAILYRAVLMTDWLFCLFYFTAFYFSAAAAMKLVLRVYPRPPVLEDRFTSSEERDAVVCAFEHRIATILKVVIACLAFFVIISSIRLAILNSTTAPDHSPLLLSDQAKREVVRQLRNRFSSMQRTLPDPNNSKLVFVEPIPGKISDALKKRNPDQQSTALDSTANFATRNDLVVKYENLSPIVFYLPKGSDFITRDRIFRKRSYDCSIMRTSWSMTVFPDAIPNRLCGSRAVLVGWIDGPHPGGTWLGQVIQCIAIVPVAKNGKLDFTNAAIATPRSSEIR